MWQFIILYFICQTCQSPRVANKRNSKRENINPCVFLILYSSIVAILVFAILDLYSIQYCVCTETDMLIRETENDTIIIVFLLQFINSISNRCVSVPRVDTTFTCPLVLKEEFKHKGMLASKIVEKRKYCHARQSLVMKTNQLDPFLIPFPLDPLLIPVHVPSRL